MMCKITVAGLSCLSSLLFIIGGSLFSFRCFAKNAVIILVSSESGSITIDNLKSAEPKNREATNSCVNVDTIADTNEIV